MLLGLFVLMSISCKPDSTSSNDKPKDSASDSSDNNTLKVSQATTRTSSYKAPSSIKKLSKLVVEEDRLLYFYSDLGSVGEQMYLDKPEEWISSFEELEEIHENFENELKDESKEVKDFVSAVLEDGLENGAVMGSVGIENNLMSIAATLLEMEESGFDDSPETIFSFLNLDIAIQSNLVKHLPGLMKEEGISFSPKANKYGFYTIREQGLTIGHKGDLVILTTEKEQNAGKPFSNSTQNSKQLYNELVQAQNTLILAIPEDVKPLLSMATEIAFKELPYYYPTDGLEYLLEDVINAYQKTIARAEILDNDLHLSLSSHWDTESTYGQLLANSCKRENNNPPLNLVSPSGKPLIYAVGDLCMEDDAAIFEEYLEDFIEAMVYDETYMSMTDFFGKSWSEIIPELDGRYAFAIEDVDSRGINFASGFIGLKDGVLKDKLEEFMPILLLADNSSKYYMMDDLEGIEKMYVSLEDDGIYMVGGSAASEEMLKRMIDGKWKKAPSVKHDGYAHIDYAQILKTADVFGEMERELQTLLNLSKDMELTLDEGRSEGKAEVSLTLNFDDKATGYKGPILWQFVQLASDFGF